MTAADLAAWRNDSLRAASGTSSKREMNLIGQVFTLVRKEWRWMAQNPLSDIRRPKAVPPRDRAAAKMRSSGSKWRLAKKRAVLALARMVWYRNINMLQVYYNEFAAAIARKL